MNSEAQQQHEERQRWAAAERTKCLSDSLVSWRLYEFPGILWRDFQTAEVGVLLWNMWAGGSWIVKMRIKGRTGCCSCRTESCQSSFLCRGKLLNLNGALTGLRPGAAAPRLSSCVWVSTVLGSTCGSVQLERQTASIDRRRCLKVGQVLQSLIWLCVSASKTFFLPNRKKPEDVLLTLLDNLQLTEMTTKIFYHSFMMERLSCK